MAPHRRPSGHVVGQSGSLCRRPNYRLRLRSAMNPGSCGVRQICSSRWRAQSLLRCRAPCPIGRAAKLDRRRKSDARSAMSRCASLAHGTSRAWRLGWAFFAASRCGSDRIWGSGVRMPKKEVLCRQIRSRCRPPSISFTCSSSARGSDPKFLRDMRMREAGQPKRRECECGYDNTLLDTHQREFGAQRSHQDIAAAHTYFSSIINSAVLINGGASIALLAFYGNIFYLSW